jgi:hypothetical protein
LLNEYYLIVPFVLDARIVEMIVIVDDNLLIKMFLNFGIFVLIMMEEFFRVIYHVKHSMLLIYCPRKEEKILWIIPLLAIHVLLKPVLIAIMNMRYIIEINNRQEEMEPKMINHLKRKK